MYLEDAGIILNNHSDIFKNAFKNDFTYNENTWLKTIDDRNIMIHIYTLNQSSMIFEGIKCKYIKSFEYLINKVKNNS